MPDGHRKGGERYDWMEGFAEKPRGVLIFYFLLGMVAFAAIVVCGSVAYLRVGGSGIGANDSARLSAVAGLLQAVVGPAVSLAGSIVAVVIASFGLSILKRDVAREDRKLAEEFVRYAAEPTFQVAKALNHQYAAYITLWERHKELLDSESEASGNAAQNAAFRGLIEDCKSFAQRTRELADALEGITLSPRSAALLSSMQSFRGLSQYQAALFASTRRQGQLSSVAETANILRVKSYEMESALPSDEATKTVTGWMRFAGVVAELMRRKKIIANDRIDADFIRFGVLVAYYADSADLYNLGVALLLNVCSVLPSVSDIEKFFAESVSDGNIPAWQITKSYAADALVEPNLMEFFRRHSTDERILRLSMSGLVEGEDAQKQNTSATPQAG